MYSDFEKSELTPEGTEDEVVYYTKETEEGSFERKLIVATDPNARTGKGNSLYRGIVVQEILPISLAIAHTRRGEDRLAIDDLDMWDSVEANEGAERFFERIHWRNSKC